MSNRKSIDHKILEERLSIYESTHKARENIKHIVSLKNEKDIDNEVSRLIKTYQNFSKEDLLRMFATQKVRMHLKWQALDALKAKNNILEAELEKIFEKRKVIATKKQIKTNKFAPHIEKQELAQDIIRKMKSKSKSIKTSDSKEFYKLMTAACSRANLGAPSLSTLANYFKKYTGLKSTK